MVFHCHNCLRSISFGNFLKEYDPSLYEEYIFERYRNGKKERSNEKPDFSDFKLTSLKKTDNNHHDVDCNLVGCTPISDLVGDHFAKRYVEQRKIPNIFHTDLYFCSDFKKLIDELEPKNAYNLKPEDERLIIPFRDEEKRIIAVQGRSFKNGSLRYITIKIDKDSPKIFGLDRINSKNRVFVCEGPLDSLFLPNAIACAGSNLGSDIIPFWDDLVFVFDNEPRNKEIVQKMKQVADANKLVCVWPETIEEKDINDLILSGKTPSDIVNIIQQNVHMGLSARIAINEWKRC